MSTVVAYSTSAVLCPECGHQKTDFVFRHDGARCVECADADMLAVVKMWQAGELQESLAEGLERYISEKL
jgi:hypothetical protein